MKNLKSEMDASVKSMSGMASEEDLVAKKTDILARSIEAGKKKIEVIQGQYDRAKEKLDQLGKALDDAKRDFGENSEEALKAENAYNKQAKAVNDLGTQLNKAKADVNRMTKEMDEAGDEAKETGEELEDAGKKGKVFGETMRGVVTGGLIVKGLEAMANAAKKVVSALKDAAVEGAQYADDLMTLSAQTGIATDKLQEYQYMSELVDVSMDTLTGSMAKLTKNMGSAQGGTGKAADAFKALGVSVTDSSGNLRDNEDVFSDVVDALGKMTNETERDTLAMAIFGKSAQELNPLIKAGGDEIQRLADEAHRMGYVLDDESLEALVAVSDAMERMKNLATTVKNELAVALAPVIEMLADKLTDLVQRVDWDKVGEKIGNLLTFIMDHYKAVAVGLGVIAAGFLAVSIAASPLTLLAVAIAACVAAVIALKIKVEELTGVDMPAWASTFLAAVAGGPTLAMAQLKAATEDEVKTAEGWRQTHFKAAQDIASASLQTSQAWANAMNSMKTKMSEMAATAKAKATEIAQKFMALPGQMLKIGADIVAGLWQGIKTRSQWLIDQIKGFCQSVVNGIKNFFKIASPSKLMRDQIGVMLMRGMANGIKLGGPEVTKAMKRVGVSVMDVAETILEMVAKKEAELTEAMKAEGIDAARKEALQTQLNNVQNFSKEFTAALDAVEKKQESLTDKLRSYGNLIETVSRKGGSALGAFGGVDGIQSEVQTLERYGEILEQIKALGVSDEFLADFLATDIDSAIEYAEKLLQLPDAKRDEYLALEGQRREMQKIVEDTRAAEKSQAVALADINEQVKALEEYDRILEELKRRGTPAELMNEIAGMSVEDATTYGQLLLDMSGRDFDEYIASWEKKQKTAAKIAEKFYQGELDALVEDFASKIPAEMDGMVDDMYQVGVAAGKGLVAGLESERFAIIDVARSIAADARAALQTQEGIHSPSTKWAELGGYMAQGVAVGFAKTMQAVSPGIMQSVSSVRTSDIERVGSGIVNGLNAGSGGGISIEVPLVINGREFARAVLSDFRAVDKASPEVVYG